MRGHVYVFTGAGPGRGVSALGLVVRALAAGRRVFFVQFLAGRELDGEALLVDRFADRIELRRMGRETPAPGGEYDPVDAKWAEDGLALSRRALRKDNWNVVVMDSVLDAIERGFLDLDRLLELLDQRPPELDVVITGSRVPPEVVAAADLVTELSPIKPLLVPNLADDGAD